jgi:hypothetical protein
LAQRITDNFQTFSTASSSEMRIDHKAPKTLVLGAFDFFANQKTEHVKKPVLIA